MGMQGLTPLANFDVARHQSMDNFGTGNDPYINNFLFLHSARLNAGEYSTLVNDQLLK